MLFWKKPARRLMLVVAASLTTVMPVQMAQANDLLVAPTRVVLDGQRGTEVILNNIGNVEATYRISLELRRMTPEGALEDVLPENANEKEKSTLDIIRYAPRRVTLPPNQPQAIRIGLQNMETLPDGEYRAHMLFRAIPPTPAADAADDGSLKIQLIPIYGITIPIIVRKGDLEVGAAISNAHLGRDNEGPALKFDLGRKGQRSLFGEIRVKKAGVSEPLLVAKGIAIYSELDQRTVSLALAPEVAAQMHGDITISYYEAQEVGGRLITEFRSVLP